MRRWFSKLGSSSPSCLTSSPILSVPSPSLQVTPPMGRLLAQKTEVIPPPPKSPGAQPKNWNADFASDPSCWENLFDVHWDQVERIIVDIGEVTHDKVLTVLRFLGNMTQLLIMEMNAQPEPAIGPILDRYFINQIMEKIIEWAIESPQFLAPTFQVGLVRIYEMIVSESHTPSHCLLVHKPLLLPLIRLLEWCSSSAEKRSFTPSSIDKHFVLLLNQICTKMAQDATLLHFFSTFSGEREEQFLVFSLLIPYLYDCGDVGQLARDALLLVLSVSRKLKCVAAFIALKSNFCPVVATGLSGCFSQLPTNVLIELQADADWHKISSFEIEAMPSLRNFHSSLLFCNAVVQLQVAHEYVVSQLVTFIYNGFLLPVVLPSLIQTGQEELISATVYYHLCLDAITEAPLIQAFLKLLIIEEIQPDKKVIDVIIERISYGNQLSQVSLSLLRSIINLRCEDVMFDLIFKYLIPCTYLQPNQMYMLRNRSYVVPTAKYLLTLIPECSLKSSVLCSQDTLQSYMEEARRLVQVTADSCAANWKWTYDGLNPAPSTFYSSSDEDSNITNQFRRQSSLRSSFASAKNGLNRYFGSRSRRTTADSFTQHAPLPNLGENEVPDRPGLLLNEPESPLSDLDFTDLSITPLTPNPAMMSTSVDYFQFAYDEISESEGESFGMKSGKQVDVFNTLSAPKADSRKNSSTSGDCDTDLDVKRSFVLRGWGNIEDMDTFMDLLCRVPVPSKSKFSLEENLALIDSKIQYLDELKAENILSGNAVKDCEESRKEDKKTLLLVGQPIKCLAHQGVGPFLESLLRCLENLLDNSYHFNLQLISVLSTLSSFTQPLLASYFFDQSLAVRPGIKRLFKILDALRTRIDAFANSVEGFDVLLERGVKLLKTRADRFKKVFESNRQQAPHFIHSDETILKNGFPTTESSNAGFLRFRAFGGSMRRSEPRSLSHPHSFRYFSHKAMETQRVTMDQARAKQIVFAAIILSQFCQELSAILLQHSVIVPQPAAHVGIC